ncbi:hypothetical protein [Brunnivagina elsteri]|uniref:hypothetical protein n=1 Tax=Brunnivagina elsteri TaxID=1247191 RepID=UPI001FEAAC19|nr:hypothetical protein [Calothrix elsteri]
MGLTYEVLSGLDDLIKTLECGSGSPKNSDCFAISEICSRLDNLEYQVSGSENSNEVPSTKRL